MALSEFSEKEKKELLKKLRLLRLGKLSTKDIEALLKKLRITAKYYESHKDQLEQELQVYLGKGPA
jgi:predicted nuclease of predicted toxin-antitoxin system